MGNNIERQTLILQCLERVDFGILIVDADYGLLWCNHVATEAVNSTPEMAVADAWALLLKSNDAAFYNRLKEIEFFEKREMQYVIPFSRKRYRISVFQGNDHQTIILKEVTGQPASEHFLLDERNVDILINITEHPIWLVDVHCRLILCNTAFKKWIARYTGVELGTGDSVLDDELDSTYLAKFRMCYELALTGKSFATVEDLMVDGVLTFNTVNFSPVKDNNNRITGVSCYATDITDHRKSLSRIEAQTQLLMEIANIQSHKVRGPVATLLGLVNVFNFEDYADPTNAEVIEGIAVVIEKLDFIVTDVIRSINRLSPRK